MVEKRKIFTVTELPEPINLGTSTPIFLEIFQVEPVDTSLCLEWLIERWLQKVPVA